MTRHIRSCLKKELKNRPSVRSSNLIHLHVIDAHDPEYFLHLLVSGSTLLNELDTYLRSIWLECCGHMSAFMDPRYHEDMDMSATIKTAFAYDSTLEYQYDFGSTTELSVSKLDIYSGTSDITEKINLLARN
ncbi:MAG: hypothetical protein GY866_23160, partial [Proteobacteria bacterium]|nr:hypothetical protein [Pseudomonadota bacterium]